MLIRFLFTLGFLCSVSLGFGQITKINFSFSENGVKKVETAEAQSADISYHPGLSDSGESIITLTFTPGPDDKVTYLEFRHRFDFGENGMGMVELSYDGGFSWHSIQEDKYGGAVSGFFAPEAEGFQSASDGYMVSQYQWVWRLRRPDDIRVRFRINDAAEAKNWDFTDLWVFGFNY